jgi:hypothetical protein
VCLDEAERRAFLNESAEAKPVFKMRLVETVTWELMTSSVTAVDELQRVREEHIRILERELLCWKDKRADYERKLNVLLDDRGSASAVNGMIETLELAQYHIQCKEQALDWLKPPADAGSGLRAE